KRNDIPVGRPQAGMRSGPSGVNPVLLLSQSRYLTSKLLFLCCGFGVITNVPPLSQPRFCHGIITAFSVLIIN
ncbi:hypothetical protein AVEN_186729-1, partial [Araneus ventricosus]